MVARFKQMLNALTELEDYLSADGKTVRCLRGGVWIGLSWCWRWWVRR